MKKDDKTITYIQGLKFCATMVIIIVHMGSLAYQSMILFMSETIFNVFAFPINGKTAVSVLCVLTGYFAYLSIKSKDEKMAKQGSSFKVVTFLVNKYLRFMPIMFLGGCTLALARKIALSFPLIFSKYTISSIFLIEQASYKALMLNPLGLNPQGNPPLWVIPFFFGAYLVTALVYKIFRGNTKRQIAVFWAILIINAIFTRQSYDVLGPCLIGVLWAATSKEYDISFLKPKTTRKKICYLVAIVVLFSIYVTIPLASLAHGAAAILFIELISETEWLKNAVGNKNLVKLGNSIYVLLCFQIPFFVIVSTFINNALKGIPSGIRFMINLAISIPLLLVITYLIYILIEVPSNKIIKKYTVIFEEGYEKLTESIKRSNSVARLEGQGRKRQPDILLIISLLFVFIPVAVYVAQSSGMAVIDGSPVDYGLSMDYWVHIGIADRLFNGFMAEPNKFFQVCYFYPMYHFTTKLISILPLIDINMASAFAISIFNGLTVVLVYSFLSGRIKTVKEKYWAAFCTFGLFVAINVYIPSVTQCFYLPMGSPNVWHNPTIIATRPFCLLACYYFAKSFDNAKNNESYKMNTLMFGVAMFLSAVGKPNFAIAALPAAAIMVTILFLFKKGKTFWYSFSTLIAVSPTVAIVLLQLFFSRLTERGKGQFISLKFDVNMTLIYFGFSAMLAIVVLLLKGYKRIFKDSLYSLSWLTFIMAFSQYAFTVLGDFIWGYCLASFVLLLVNVKILYFDKEKSSRPLLAIGTVIFLAQIASGIYYLVQIFSGKGAFG